MAHRERAAGGRRVLVVEDDAGCREALYEVLTLFGRDVVAVATGAHALDAARAFQP